MPIIPEPPTPEALNGAVMAARAKQKQPELIGGTSMPEELTGRASATDESLTALFRNDTAEHFRDGFRGGSDGDEDVAIPKDDAIQPEA